MTAAPTRTGATFYFDPGCPWTWMTSRWLVAAAQERALDIRWRTFSLALLNEDRPLPPDRRRRLTAESAWPGPGGGG